MGTFLKLVTLVAGPGALLGTAAIVLAVADALVSGECNTWSACVASAHLIAFISWLVLVCSSAGLLITCLTQLGVIRSLSSKWLVALLLFLATAQAAMFFTLQWLPNESIWLTLIGWACASAVLGWLALLAARRLAPNNSFKPKPLRGSA